MVKLFEEKNETIKATINFHFCDSNTSVLVWRSYQPAFK